jgi:hypothetical protein
MISLVMFSLVPMSAFAAELGAISYWYSDKDIITRWTGSRTVYATLVDTSFTSTNYNSYVTHARTEWTYAGISSSTTTNESFGNIKIYGGNYTNLKSIEPALDTNNTGLTVYQNLTYEGDWHYAGTYLKQGSTTSCVKMYIVCIAGRTSNGYKKTATHEFGHVLGWRGHSGTSADVMYSTASEVTSLTARDKNHLVQIY